MLALITGASSGIGLELAKLFAKDQYDLVLIARQESSLQKIADDLETTFGIQVFIYAIDLAKSNAAEKVFLFLKKYSLEVDVLVNNAGFATYGAFEKTSLETQLEMIQLNISTLTALTSLFLPQLRTKKHGRILNLASTAAFLPGPYMAVYFATKAFVLSFSEALAEELSGTNVTVTALCPGPTRTNFEKRASDSSVLSFQGKIMTPEVVAKIGYQALHRGQRVVVAGVKNKAFAFLAKLTPHRLLTKAIKKALAPTS